jgi:hypothetical protein
LFGCHLIGTGFTRMFVYIENMSLIEYNEAITFVYAIKLYFWCKL